MNDNINIISKLNEETNIVDLVSEFVQLEKRGKNYMGLCPFHQEKTPSFSVSPEKNIAVCMSCKEGGAPLTFYSKIKNIPFAQAIDELALRLGIKVEKRQTRKDPNENYYQIMQEAAQFYQFSLKNTKQGQQAITYLEKRGITEDLIDHFQIGWSPKETDALYLLLKDKGYNVSDMIRLGLVKQNEMGNYYDLFRSRLVFPITNTQGKVVGFSGRTLDKNEQVKYMNSPETPIFKKGEILYQYFESLSESRKQNKVILYEGFFDVIASHQAGLKNSVATMGTALTDHQAKLIKKSVDEVIIAYDGDNAGKNSAVKASDLFTKNQVKVTMLNIPDKLDPDDYLKKYGKNQFLKLFKENLTDSYEFRYQMALNHKDLTNAFDLNQLKNDLQQTFKSADSNIKKLYETKIKKELGLEINLNFQSKAYNNVQANPFEPVKPQYETNRLPDKYTWAENTLLSEVLQKPDYLRYILDKLNFYELSDHKIVMVFDKISEMYQTGPQDKIDIDLFMDVYPEYKDIILKVTNHFDWKEKKQIKSLDELDYYINLFNVETANKKELKDLETTLKTETNQDKQKEMLQRIIELQRAINQKKWGL